MKLIIATLLLAMAGPHEDNKQRVFEAIGYKDETIMAPRFSIDTNDWPSSGTATTATTGFHDLTEDGWEHGEDEDGKYIEQVVDAGNVIAEPDNMFNYTMSNGDRLRLRWGFKCIKTVETFPDDDHLTKFFDSFGGAGRTQCSFRFGTDYFNGDGFIVHTDIISGGTENDYQAGNDGLNFGTKYEIDNDYSASTSGGWYRCFINGFQVAKTESPDSVTSTSGRELLQIRALDIGTSKGFKFRLYGDRDGLIQGWDDDFEIRPRTDEETDWAFRPIDMDLETADDARNFWHVPSGDANTTFAPTVIGGITTNRNRAVVSGGAATLVLRDGFDAEGAIRKMIKVDGIIIDTGGDMAISFRNETPGPTYNSPLDIRFDGSGNVQYRIDLGTWTTLFSYTEGVYYTLRVNRAAAGIKVAIENMTDQDFSSSNHFSDVVTITAPGADGFKDDLINYVQVDGEDFQFDGLYAMNIDSAGGISSYTAADQSLNGVVRRIPNRIWSHVPGSSGMSLVPGSVLARAGSDVVVRTSTLGSSGDNITNFIDNALDGIEIFAGAGRLVFPEFLINDLSGARLSEASTIIVRDELVTKIKLLMDQCEAWDIKADFAQPILYPLGGQGIDQLDWQDFTHDAILYIVKEIRAYMNTKPRGMFRWLNVEGDTDTYFETDGAGAPLDEFSDDIHFLRDLLYARAMLADPEDMGGGNSRSRSSIRTRSTVLRDRAGTR